MIDDDLARSGGGIARPGCPGSRASSASGTSCGCTSCATSSHGRWSRITATPSSGTVRHRLLGVGAGPDGGDGCADRARARVKIAGYCVRGGARLPHGAPHARSGAAAPRPARMSRGGTARRLPGDGDGRLRAPRAPTAASAARPLGQRGAGIRPGRCAGARGGRRSGALGERRRGLGAVGVEADAALRGAAHPGVALGGERRLPDPGRVCDAGQPADGARVPVGPRPGTTTKRPAGGSCSRRARR